MWGSYSNHCAYLGLADRLRDEGFWFRFVWSFTKCTMADVTSLIEDWISVSSPACPLPLVAVGCWAAISVDANLQGRYDKAISKLATRTATIHLPLCWCPQALGLRQLLLASPSQVRLSIRASYIRSIIRWMYKRMPTILRVISTRKRRSGRCWVTGRRLCRIQVAGGPSAK